MFRFFDRLEDDIRTKLSRHPVVYSLIGGVSIVLFWRGVWMTADLFPFLTGPISVALSVAILLLTGLFVSFFVGDTIILSGIRGEKKLIEKTEDEMEREAGILEEIRKDIKDLKVSVGNVRREHAVSAGKEERKDLNEWQRSIE